MRRTWFFIGLLLWAANCLGSDLSNGWEYKYDVGSPGTRSEGVYGRLLYRKNELPKEFDHVVTPIGEFAFLDHREFGSNEKIRWVPVGKYPDGRMRAAVTRKDVEQLLSGNDPNCRSTATKEAPGIVSSRPYIAGTFEKRPEGVGPEWFYAFKPGLWINPQKVEEALKAVSTE